MCVCWGGGEGLEGLSLCPHTPQNRSSDLTFAPQLGHSTKVSHRDGIRKLLSVADFNFSVQPVFTFPNGKGICS